MWMRKLTRRKQRERNWFEVYITKKSLKMLPLTLLLNDDNPQNEDDPKNEDD